MTTDLTPRPLGDDDLEQALRGAFRRGADAVPAAADPWARTTRAVRRSRVRRRTAALAVAASVALAGVVGSATGGLPFLRADRAAPADPRDVQVTTDIGSWPTRGERAGDKAFVAGLRTAMDREGVVAGLLYAGDLGGRPVGVGVVGGATGVPATRDNRLVVVRADDGPPQQWPTAQGVALVEDGAPQFSGDRVTVALQAADGSTDLLVLTRTDTAVAVSWEADYDDAAAPSRRFTALRAVGGVATARRERAAATAITVRTQRRGEEPVLDGVQVLDSSRPAFAPDRATVGSVVASAPCRGALTAQEVTDAVSTVVDARDPDPAAGPRSFEALWCRAVRGGRLGLLAVTLSDGTQVQTRVLVGDDGGTSSTVADQGVVVPRGAARTTPAVVEDLPPNGIGSTRWFVHAPGAATAEVRTTADGEVLATGRPDRDGFVELEAPAAALERITPESVVVLRDGDGATTAQPWLFAPQADPFGLQVDGPVS
ncbi:hypothetical protein [Kineosporia sp. A_224]|uniref:hypothetical protein n=1 Tax=Kineosporia sp. A_224 TaxID=1962180 RepID=UPI000B4BCE7B|nr:hypothetical protein [Kineosporia sp. A_224]